VPLITVITPVVPIESPTKVPTIIEEPSYEVIVES
jgi:hypothetical protein